MLTPFIFSFILSVLLSLLITPLVIKLAHKIGATDAPGERKVHSTVMPRIGGMAIFFSTMISILSTVVLFPDLLASVLENSNKTAVLFLCFVSLFALGFWDDLKSLSPGVKFGVQLVLAAIIYFAGFKISNITHPLGFGMLDVEFIDFGLTLLWIVGVTNAFNLIDGLDGLASGVATIACVTIFLVSAISGQVEVAIFSLILAGALIGFLRYNFNPAKIFLGDSGSLFIGFALAMLSIQSNTKTSTWFALLFPILVLVLPITDTVVSMLRRLIGSFLTKKNGGKARSILHRLHGMFTPDKSHIHHRLLSMGLSHRNTVLVLYFISSFFAFSGFMFTQIDLVQRAITIAITLAIVLFIFIKKLRYHELAIFNNGLMIPFYEKWFLNRSVYISMADILFITAAYSLSYMLMHSINPATIEFLNFERTIIPVLSLQLAALWLTGIYREKMNQFGIGNALHITTSVAYAVGITAFAFSILNVLPFVIAIQFLILDFYFLITFILGFRMAYQVLSFWFNRDKKSGENVLIYGAGDNGAMFLHKTINSPNNKIKVLGFLDDDPELEDKIIYGYPILGGHWKLIKIHQSMHVDSIYICDESIKCENLRRVKNLAHRNGIAIKKLNVVLQGIDYKPEIDEKKTKIISPAPVYENANIIKSRWKNKQLISEHHGSHG